MNERKESTPPFIRTQRQLDEANKNLKLEERVRHELFANNSKNKNNAIGPNPIMKSESNKNVHKRQESESKLSLNFVRGFRRENSDFFPLSKRHSAVLGERLSSQSHAVQRSSAIFQRNRNKGEPVLTDFITKRDNSLNNNLSKSSSTSSASQNNYHHQQQMPNMINSDFFRPRREKTESNIIVRNSTTRQLLLEQQQVMD